MKILMKKTAGSKSGKLGKLNSSLGVNPMVNSHLSQAGIELTNLPNLPLLPRFPYSVCGEVFGKLNQLTKKSWQVEYHHWRYL